MNKKRKLTFILFCFMVVGIVFYILFCAKQFHHIPLKVFIFQTSDTHGHLNNKTPEHSNGWLKLGSIMRREIRKTGGRNNCLLIDCGDTFQGTIEASEAKGDFTIPFMNSLGYDAFVPGNHDFDFGFNIFLNRISNLNADVLAANLITMVQSKKEILPWKIYIKNDVKIAVIGMTSPYLNYWLWGKDHKTYSVMSISETLKKVMPDVLKTKPDIIVLAIHHGLYNSKRFPGKDNFLRNVIKKYPQIDIVLGGHTHQIYPGESLCNNTVYVQSGAHAEYFSKLEIEIDKYGKNPPQIKMELVPVLPTELPDKQLTAIVADTIKKSNVRRKEIVGKSNTAIGDKGVPGINNRMGELFADAIFQTVKADAAMCSVIKSGYELNGNITYNDIFNICPYEDTIVILSLKFTELKKIIEEQDTYKDKYRKKLGLYTVDSLKNGKDVGLSKDRRFLVAFSSHDVAGAGNRYPILKEITQKPDVRAFDTQILLRDAVVNYIRNKSLSF